MKLILITFGGSNGNDNGNYVNAVDRLKEQAKQFEMFDEIHGFTREDLMNDTEFWSKHGEFISRNKRGYGYWIWKSYLAEKVFRKTELGDIIVYLDSGCELNIHGKEKLKDYINLTVIHDSLFMKLSYINWPVKSGPILEKEYTKMDLLNHTGSNPNIQQVAGGIFFLKRTESNLEYLNDLRKLCVSNNYHFVDNSPSVIPNDISFCEHRHDQSCTSVMVAKYNLFSIQDETYYGDSWNKSDYISFPILAFRNKTGKTRL